MAEDLLTVVREEHAKAIANMQMNMGGGYGGGYGQGGQGGYGGAAGYAGYAGYAVSWAILWNPLRAHVINSITD
jgi:hypothetical protein